MENNLEFALNMETLRTAYKRSSATSDRDKANVLENGVVVAFKSVNKHDCSNSTELYLNTLPTGFIIKRDMSSIDFIKVCGVDILKSLEKGVLKTFVDTIEAINTFSLEKSKNVETEE